MRKLGKFSVAWNLVLLCLLGFGDCEPFSNSHRRTDEIKKRCASVISSAIELEYDTDFDAIQQELSFIHGEWRQDEGDHPIIPNLLDNAINLGDFYKNHKEPGKLASFWITGVNDEDKIENSVSVNGTLGMGFSNRISEGWNTHSPFFFNQMESTLYIHFEGIYVKSDANGGERVLCLLGRTELPLREPDLKAPWEWAKNFSDFERQPPVKNDDHIVLTLRYPGTFSLKKRMVIGKMNSFNDASSLLFFDDVEISSSLSNIEGYQFGSQETISEACELFSDDEYVDEPENVYKGDKFCKFFSDEELEIHIFSFLPNLKCNRSREFCTQLGPFGAHTIDGSFARFEMRMSNVVCKYNDSSTATVSAVFKAYEVHNNDHYYSSTSSLDNMTLVAEGTWNSSSGQLCMIGCVFEGENAECNVGIRFKAFQTVSLTQMSPFFGTISSLQGSDAPFYPLSFKKSVLQSGFYWFGKGSYSIPIRYSYSKMKDACTLLDKTEAFNLRTVVKKRILNYPKMDNETASFLGKDLSFMTSDLVFEIFSVGPIPLWARTNPPYNFTSHVCGREFLVNVSAMLTTTAAVIAAEGVYDPRSGKMFLVGCKQIIASWEILRESVDLERGFDCLIEIQVTYPPLTSIWTVDPSAKITISSKRNDGDPLYFEELSVNIVRLFYSKEADDILSAKSVETMLETATLSFAVVCIMGQFVYLKRNPNAAPFMSLVMLGIQAIGHCLPLIIKNGSPERFSSNSGSRRMHLSDYVAKILTLSLFSLTVMLFQKVRKSRIRSSGTQLLPNERLILYITVAVHVIGYVVVVVFRSDSFQTDGGNRKWENEMTAYFGVAQDFFLLPQMIGNLVWLRCSDKPLSGLYYMGSTVVRILPHLYHYVKSPVTFRSEFADPQMDFFSEFGDVIIGVGALLFAGVLFIQQRWGFLSFSYRRYERLPVKPSENELANVHLL